MLKHIEVRNNTIQGVRGRMLRGMRALPWRTILAALLVVASVVVSATVRHWLIEAVATVCILGGIVLAPVVSLVAWLGMVLPEHTPLHQVSPVLFAAALIWLSMAIIGAHAHHGKHS